MAAWFCANSPQAATYEVMIWAKGAQHFSHQERLQAEVAFILSGPKATATEAMAKAGPVRPSLPPMAAEVVLKKLELYALTAVGWLAPPRRALGFPAWSCFPPDRAQPEPLLPPPRGDGLIG